jgi:uncharacterized membrane protein YdjX (TVP38/TMEM64 family)
VNRPPITKAVVIVLLALAILGGAALAWSIDDGFGMVKGIMVMLDDLADRHPVVSAVLFLAVHVTIAALWLPMEILMMTAAGALFGFVEGVILASFGTSIGATLAFLEARFLLRDTVMRRFGRHLARVDEGMTRDGPFYLFSLRLLPVFPFFLTNVTMGLTALPVRTFYIVSQVALLPAVMVYVNAGTQVAKLESLSDIVSPELIMTLAAMALLPWAGKALVILFQKVRKT